MRARLSAGLFLYAVVQTSCASRYDFNQTERSPDRLRSISILNEAHFPSFIIRNAGTKIVAGNGAKSHTLYERLNDSMIDFTAIVWGDNHRTVSVLVCDGFGPDVILQYDFRNAAANFGDPAARDRLASEVQRKYARWMPTGAGALDWACSTDGANTFDVKRQKQ